MAASATVIFLSSVLQAPAVKKNPTLFRHFNQGSFTIIKLFKLANMYYLIRREKHARIAIRRLPNLNENEQVRLL